MNSIMNEIRNNFDVADSKLDKNILELSKQGKVEEFFGKHPYLPYEKVYGLQNQNYWLSY